MVRLSIILSGSRKVYRRAFIDSLRIYVKGGAGGMGVPKFGGVGGQGGDVYTEASDEENLTFKKIFKSFPSKRCVAESGGNSSSHMVLGKRAKDLIIPCPTGVIVYTDNGHKLGEMDKVGDKILVAKGGSGGRFQNQFNGQPGQAHSVILDLKLIADVGLVGYPNAGKSSLLKAISNAKPKIANYPFTTICPQLGMLEYDDHRQITMADLPGLIEGAHNNVGLGYRFLKHVERTKILLFVIDINGFQLNPQSNHRTAFETLVLLNKELELYRDQLMDVPSILAINKMDVEGATDVSSSLLGDIKNIHDVTKHWSTETRPKKFIKFDDVLLISAATGTNVPLLKQRIRELIDLHADELAELNPEVKAINILVKKQPSVIAR